MTNVKEWKKMIRQMRGVLDELPSAQEKDELVRAISEVIQMLTQLNEALVALPTAEEAARAKEALDRLEFVVNTNPLLRSAGSKRKPASRKSKEGRLGSSAEAPLTDIQQEIQLLRKSGSGVRDHLAGKRYTKDVLRQILAGLGRRAASSASKRELVEQVVTALDVERTYEGIGNAGDAR